jgi:CheY-like chemotaxis protein
VRRQALGVAMTTLPPLVLVVEDEEDVRTFLVDILAEEGYRTAGVTNGRDALTFLAAHPDTGLIILDLMMPVMDGWTFRTKQLADPAISPIPVVVFTAATKRDNLIIRAEELRACGYLPKPGDLDRLLELVERCLRSC